MTEMGKTRFPSREEVQKIREEYPPGTRISLIKMNDNWAKQKPGDRATVTHVDAIGTVFCRWDIGSSLGLAYGEDEYRKLTPEELAEEREMSLSEQNNDEMTMEI